MTDDDSRIAQGFSSPTVCRITGVAPSTLHYWATTGVVVPSLRQSTGKRATRWWSLSDLIAVRSVRALREVGCPLQTLRRAQEVIRAGWDENLGEAVLHWDGVDLLRLGRVGEVQSTIVHPGQGILHVVALPVGAWQAAARDHFEQVDLDRLKRLSNARAERPKEEAVPATSILGQIV